MTEPTSGVKLTTEDVDVVLQAIREGRVRGLDDVPYDPKDWDKEAVLDWLKRTHMHRRARQIVTTLRRGHKIKSRPVVPTVNIALRALRARISQLEREVADLKQRMQGDVSAT